MPTELTPKQMDFPAIRDKTCYKLRTRQQQWYSPCWEWQQCKILHVKITLQCTLYCIYRDRSQLCQVAPGQWTLYRAYRAPFPATTANYIVLLSITKMQYAHCCTIIRKGFQTFGSANPWNQQIPAEILACAYGGHITIPSQTFTHGYIPNNSYRLLYTEYSLTPFLTLTLA